MAFLAPEQVPLFLLLMLPGFISRRVYDLQIPGNQDDAGRYALDALGYGTLNAALWIAPLTWMTPFLQWHPLLLWLVALLALIIGPVGLGVATVRVLQSTHLRRWSRHPLPTAWDYYFSRRTPCWMLFRLKNGKSIGGYCGLRSFASSYPHGRDIYVEQAWVVSNTGQFLRAAPDSAGALISFDECDLIEFFLVLPDTNEVNVHVDQR